MPPITPSAAVGRRAQDLFGAVDWAAAVGIIHVVATYTRADGALGVIAIGPDAPRSATDAFVLDLVRARADTIVTTGKILRDEPELRYGLQPDHAAGLIAWRREVLSRPAPPRVLVLTAGDRIDFEHPAFHGWATPVIFTGHASAARLDAPSGIEVVGHDDPSLAAAVAWCRERGDATVAIEAGPATSRVLYDPTGPVQPTELMLSRYLGPSPPAAACGEALLEPGILVDPWVLACAPTQVQEASGPWRFERWLRTG